VSPEATVVKALQDDRRACRHGADRFAPIVGGSEGRPVGARFLCDLRRRNVGLEGRFAEYAHIDHQRSDALALDLLLEKRVFGGLCVQSANDGDDLVCHCAFSCAWLEMTLSFAQPRSGRRT
jgi:hypothetical protein